jgi:hypothetical protein
MLRGEGGGRRAEMTELVDRLYGTPPDVLELVRKINASR